jgi:DNA repair protein RadC
MSYLIKEMNDDERPRERFKKYGVEALSNTELLSILMRCGTKSKSVMEVSSDLLKIYNMNDFSNINYNVLKDIKGIGEVKAMTLISAIEFGKRVLNKVDLNKQIRCSNDVYELVKSDLENELQEKLLVIFLNTRKYVIDKKIIFIGTVNSSVVHARDVFREAVKCNAVSLILVHNHPAGSIKPSYQDIEMTNKFISIGKLMDIDVIDHLIVGKNSYYSFLESNGDLFAK